MTQVLGEFGRMASLDGTLDNVNRNWYMFLSQVVATYHLLCCCTGRGHATSQVRTKSLNSRALLRDQDQAHMPADWL